MIKLYFGNIPTIISTLLIVGFAVFFGIVMYKRETINHWGLLVLAVFFIGLFMSIMSGVKDGVGSPNALFATTSTTMLVLSILGGLVFLGAILSLFIRSSNFWQWNFYIISAIIIVKTIIVEVSRIILMLHK